MYFLKVFLASLLLFTTLFLSSLPLSFPVYAANQASIELLNESNLKPPPASSHLKTFPAFSQQELRWMGERIYANECASKPENLIHWNEGENFPSLGIGHFIWYRQDSDEKFVETFPSMVQAISAKKALPDWLAALPTMDAPWPNKAAFIAFKKTPEYYELLTWLLNSKPEQAEFISKQLIERFNTFLKRQKSSNHAASKNIHIESLFNNMMTFKQGRFALIDYVNFKGMGAETEAYQGEQWGLISVFEDMLLRHPKIYQWQKMQMLEEFVLSAKRRLKKRVSLSPVARNEQRWLKGWFKRVDGYLQAGSPLHK